MNILTSVFPLLFLTVIGEKIGAEDETLDFTAEVKKYRMCHEKPVDFTKYLLPAVTTLVTNKCGDYKKYACKALCVAQNYPGLYKDGKVDKDFLESEVKDYMSKHIELKQELQALYKAGQKCAGWGKDEVEYPEPKNVDDNCPAANNFRKCLTEAHKKICIDEPEPTTTTPNPADFLDSF